MPVARPTPEHMQGVIDSMQATLRARQKAAPEPVNHDAALSLFEPVSLRWGAATYAVRNISYVEGLQLEKLQLRLKRQSEQPHDSEAAIEAHEALVRDFLALFWGFLDPKPAANPFADLTPLEVGALAGFFSLCQRIQNHPSRMRAGRLSRLTM